MMPRLRKSATASALTSGPPAARRRRAPARRIIDHHRALGGDLGRPFLRYRRARRHQADVDVGKIILLERLHFQGLVAERDLDPHAAARRQRHDLVGRERALVEDVEHFAAHLPVAPTTRDLETHGKTPERQAAAKAAGAACF